MASPWTRLDAILNLYGNCKGSFPQASSVGRVCKSLREHVHDFRILFPDVASAGAVDNHLLAARRGWLHPACNRNDGKMAVEAASRFFPFLPDAPPHQRAFVRSFQGWVDHLRGTVAMEAAVLVLILPFASLAAFFLWRSIISRRLEYIVPVQQDHGRQQECIMLEKNPYHAIEPLPDFEWAKTRPIRNAPLKAKYHLTMAVENIPLSDIIVMDDTYVERMSIRRAIMDAHPEATLQCNSACEAAVFELFGWMYGTYLPSRFPKIYKPTPDGQAIFNTANQEQISLQPSSALVALRSLGDHIDTDFLLLLPSSQAADGSPVYHLQAFVTCCPNGFSTREKLGLPLAQIHAPVPGYKAKLEKSMDRFFAKIECGRAVKRSNWALTTNSVLFSEGGNHLYEGGKTEHHESATGAETTAPPVSAESLQLNIERQKREVVIEDCRLRSERQTLFRLPNTKALVFSFKTYLYLLDDVKKDGYAEALAEAMEGLSKGNVPDMDFYKRGVVWREKVVNYLRA